MAIWLLTANRGLPADAPKMTIKQIATHLAGVFPIDKALLNVGRRFVAAEHCAKSAWTITGKLVYVNQAGVNEHYFVKIAFGETGRVMLGGQFESSKVIHRVMPDFIPTPVGFGKFEAQGPATYFYMSEYIDMDVTTAPNPHGAHVVDWQDSWTVFYSNMFLAVCALDIRRNGPWPEYERAVQQVAWKMIPRLLDHLQEGGRPIKPCIMHGDLWEGNMGIRKQTGETMLFDAGSFYGHNEMELGAWRCEYTSVFRAPEYTNVYLLHYPAAEPEHEFDDRNRLYSLKGATNYSAGHTGSELRKTAYNNNMCYLCEKYAPLEGIDKYDPSIDPSLTGARIVPHQDTAEDLI